MKTTTIDQQAHELAHEIHQTMELESGHDRVIDLEDARQLIDFFFEQALDPQLADKIASVLLALRG